MELNSMSTLTTCKNKRLPVHLRLTTTGSYSFYYFICIVYQQSATISCILFSSIGCLYSQPKYTYKKSVKMIKHFMNRACRIMMNYARYIYIRAYIIYVCSDSKLHKGSIIRILWVRGPSSSRWSFQMSRWWCRRYCHGSIS